MVSASTLFHLVPLDPFSRQVLEHPENRRFVSQTDNAHIGLEVGFHVAKIPGHVIARLGRNADIILSKRTISAVHVAFEIHPETLVVLLRSKQTASVFVEHKVDEIKCEPIEGDCVLSYGERYEIIVDTYCFLLEWKQSAQASKKLAAQDYQRALRQQENINSRFLPTERDTEIRKFYNTRLHASRLLSIREADGEPRVFLGKGEFGIVSKTVDKATGLAFAVKQIQLHKINKEDNEQAKATARREVDILKNLHHENIITFLGHDKWDTPVPEIYMPLRTGTLRSLANTRDKTLCTDDQLVMQLLEQILCALDYLADQDICHRDVKPDNILYRDKGNGEYHLELADFGLAQYRSPVNNASGSGYFRAPEVLDTSGPSRQSPKLDIWSLYITILVIHTDCNFPPIQRSNHHIFAAVRRAARAQPLLADMAHEDPSRRASAAQMLQLLFNGKGLTTKEWKIPPLATQIEMNERASAYAATASMSTLPMSTIPMSLDPPEFAEQASAVPAAVVMPLPPRNYQLRPRRQPTLPPVHEGRAAKPILALNARRQEGARKNPTRIVPEREGDMDPDADHLRTPGALPN